ncbi:hypothetical protein HYALB_00006879 [Hymenoscyphus albidus]|uniref:Putative 5'-nucleotidase C-terminal domain-containing protein n=1 Tax=Hymenoscyphus albidus TaxID=595503 RepID=A0A9N9QDW1_9HELO|nr:hypothetical protein HYALB_00006879 [Hymenoscyphus albidus]
MTFGVLFDFTGNSNVSKIIKAADMVKQQWFLDAVNQPEPIDVFLLIGHNPIRTTDYSSTFGLLHKTIRTLRPDTPIQEFGGHSHIRDFQVYDDRSTGLESGRYCETLGWLSMSGINSSTFTGNVFPRGVANPTRPATNTSTSGIVYSRRYLDWNRATFAYHATSSQDETFDYHSGLRVSGEVTKIRKQLNLSSLYGCAPATYCLSCKPFGDPGNIFSLIPVALGATVINQDRAQIPRYILINSGSIRFDLVKGPFTYDDSFIVSPFNDTFQYIKEVPYEMAVKVLNSMNGATLPDKRSSPNQLFGSMPRLADRTCADPILSSTATLKTRGIHRRQTSVTLGYVTSDDFGTDGDDTVHSKIPNFRQPNYIQGNGSFPVDGTTPAVVDVVFFDYFANVVVSVSNAMGASYTMADVDQYVGVYSAQNYLPDYAKLHWQENMPACPVGQGVGYPDRKV